MEALPGFGDEKARIFVALLAKRFGVRPRRLGGGVRAVRRREPRSAADIETPEAFERVKAWKRTMRPQGKTKQDPPTPPEHSASLSGAALSGLPAVPLAVQPADQHGDGAGVEPQIVGGAGDDAQVGGPVPVGQDPGVEHRDRVVVGAMHDDERRSRRASAQPTGRTRRRSAAQLSRSRG